jgi:hypothetical protein
MPSNSKIHLTGEAGLDKMDIKFGALVHLLFIFLKTPLVQSYLRGWSPCITEI